ncbi:MAG TPA: response regulator [Pyrinomonadaceae bacterium]|jgi:CheY-like chemotaxis protein
MFDEKLPPGNESVPPKTKILLADDDASIRRFLEIVLGRLNYDVTIAEDGLSAMKLALAENFDLVVADAVMPNLTGYDLCRILKHNPQYKNVPLVILSGMENKAENPDQCLADAYLLKGENLKQQLAETLSSLLAQRLTA